MWLRFISQLEVSNAKHVFYLVLIASNDIFCKLIISYLFYRKKEEERLHHAMKEQKKLEKQQHKRMLKMFQKTQEVN